MGMSGDTAVGSGLRVVLDLQNRLAAVGARLVLAAPSPQVRRVLAATELKTTWPATERDGRRRTRLWPAAGTTNAVPGG